MRPIAASEVEGLMLGQVQRLLASPELVARTITAMLRESGAAEDARLRRERSNQALGALEPIWDELYPAERARTQRPVAHTLHATGIRSLVTELASEQAAAPEPRHDAISGVMPSRRIVSLGVA